MHRYRNLIILVSAIAFLLLAVALEHPFFRAEVGEESVIFNLGSVASLAKEIAFALLIALLIILGIETESKRADQESADRLRREIALEVFKGVFSRQLPRSYVDLVISRNLMPPLLRKNLQVDYVIDEVPIETCTELKIPPGKYVLLKSRAEFCITNPNLKTVEETLSVRNPRLPRPEGSLSKVEKFMIGDSRQALVDQLGIVQYEELRDQTVHGILLKLGPNESKYVAVQTTLLKEISDNHIWGSFHPTLRTDISVSVRVPGITTGFRFSTATPGSLVHQSDDGSFSRWEVDGPTLPNDSFVLWWREK